jgi:PAS domain S-box-containing protein
MMTAQIKILIVEDERLAAEDLSMRLSRIGYQIVGIASTSEDAVAAALKHQPNAILMDIQLRGKIDGIETARLIHESLPVPVIFTTAYGDDEHVKRAMEEADPYGFLHKPIDEHAVSTLIKIALARFVKDQHILKINNLLKVKTNIFTSLGQVESIPDISGAVSTAFCESESIQTFWMLCLSEICGGGKKIIHGIEAEVFEGFVRQFDLEQIQKQAVLQDNPFLTELLDTPAYFIPVLLGETDLMGIIGFTMQDDLPLEQNEASILIDISRLISQKLEAFRQAEEQETVQRMIQESESRLKAIVEKSTTGIYLIDSEYHFEYVNDRLCEIYGRDRDELIGTPFPQFLGKSRDLVVERYLSRQAGEPVPSEYEMDVIRPSGEVRELIISANSFTDVHGNIKSAGHLLDVTEQKEANLELQKLSKAIEQSPVMVVITDVQGRIEYVNSQFTQTMGYSFEDVKGQNPRIFKSGDANDSFYSNLWGTILRGDTWSGELSNKKKSGELTWERSSISPIRDSNGEITHFVAVKEDITQIQKEQAISLKNQMLRDVLYEITSMAIKSQKVSSLYEHIFQSLKTIISTSNFFLALHDKVENKLTFPFERDSRDSDLPESLPFDPDASLTARTIVQGKTLHLQGVEIEKALQVGSVHRSGDIPASWLGIPLRVDNDVIGAIVLQEYTVGHDYLDEDIRMLEVAAGQVALAIDRVRKEDALRRLAEELSNANGLKELLLDVITHDLRNPAGVISAVTDLIDDEGEVYDILKGSSESLMKVIENATVLSKLSLGERIAKSELDLIPVIQDVVAEFSSQLSTAGMIVNLDLPESFIIEANPIISEIPKNYISNAIKYSADGLRIDINLVEKDGQYVLCVNDYGTPIPEDKREAIFQRSVQLAEGQKKGRGLGLAIVRRIADEHDSVVGVEKNDAGGNCFYLKFPANPGDATA